MTKPPETIDAVATLSHWYGPNSLACSTVRIISEREAQSEFTVPPNLCGPAARPPMFDRLLHQNGVFTTQTSPEDAKEHFIESVGISVVPGHNIMGLVAEGLTKYYRPKGREAFFVTGFDYMRFRGMVYPGQEIRFSGEIDQINATVLATLVMSLQRRPFTANFCMEPGEVLNADTRRKLLAQHWIFEANAQGLGMVALAVAPEGVIPVLMEAGRSTFTKVPVLAGDTLRSDFTGFSADAQQVLGNVRTYVNQRLIAEQENLLLQFVPTSKIKQSVEDIKI